MLFNAEERERVSLPLIYSNTTATNAAVLGFTHTHLNDILEFTVTKKTLMLLVLMLTILQAACTSAPTSSQTDLTTTAETDTSSAATTTDASLFPLTITDAAGQEFTFDAPPRIGCWWAGCTEILADLGVAAHASRYTDELANAVFNFPAGAPLHNIADTSNPEDWAAAEVDIVIMRVPVAPEHEAYKLATPVFYLHHPSYGESAQNGYAAFLENLRLVGQLTGKPEAAEAAIARFNTALDTLRTLSTPEIATQTVAVLFQGDGYRMIGPGNPFCVALAEAQLGTCIGEGAASYEVNAEEFLGLDPDWIVYQTGDASHQDRTDPIWAELSAVKAGQVYDATNNRYYCCSTRGLILALQDYASYVLPDGTVPATGPQDDFDPTQSPLVQPAGNSADNAATGTTRTIEHFLGVTDIPANPQRIIAMHDLQILGALLQFGVTPVGSTEGTEPRLIGDFTMPAGIVDIGGNFTFNLEAIAALNPDLIIALETHEEFYEQLSAIAPTVTVRDYNAEDALSTQRTIAEIVGKTDIFNEQVAAYEARVATIHEQLAPMLDTLDVSVFGVYENLYVTEELGWTYAKAFNDLGITMVPAVAALAERASLTEESVTLEEVPQLDGDVIFLINPNWGEGLRTLEASGLLDLTFAAQHDQLFYVDANHWYRGGLAGLNLVLDDIEEYLLGRELDTSGEFGE